MLLELVEKGAHSVVEDLDDAVVEGGSDPWALRVEGEALDAVAFGLEFDKEGIVLSHGRMGHYGG